MSALEREIMDLFHQLQPAAKQRIRLLIDREASNEAEPVDFATFDYDAWWAEVEGLQADIRLRIGENGTVGALSLLDELREEAS